MKFDRIRDLLNFPTFSANDINLTYRSINHYEEKGLLISKRTNSSSWRKFTGIEVIWLNLVSILREMGMPLSKITKLFDKIFIEGKEGSIDKASFIIKSFEEEIIESISHKKDLYILIFFDCAYTFHDSTSLNQWHNGIYKNEPHINIPLTPLIQETLYKLNKE